MTTHQKIAYLWCNWYSGVNEHSVWTKNGVQYTFQEACDAIGI